MIGNSTTSPDINLFKIVKGGRSKKNELLGLAFKLYWSDDTCNFKRGAVVMNEALHFTPMKDSWERNLAKELYQAEEMSMNEYWDRDMFKRNCPKEYQNWSETQITRFEDKMVEYGWCKRIQKNKYKWIPREIEDFIKD